MKPWQSFASMFMHTHNDVIRYFRDQVSCSPACLPVMLRQESKLNPSILNKDTSSTNFLDDEVSEQEKEEEQREEAPMILFADV